METKTPETQNQVSVSYPPQDIFASSQGANQAHEVIKHGTQTFVLDRVEYPESGGIFLYLKGLLYPRKGFPFPEAIWAVNCAKKIILILVFGLATKDILLPAIAFMFLGWKKKIRIMEKVLSRLTEATNYAFAPYLLQDRFYMRPAMALRKWCKSFLVNLGIQEHIAEKAALTVCMFIEYDNAYRQRIQDAFTYNVAFENGKVRRSDILRDPRKFITSLIETIKSREPGEQDEGNEGVLDKYRSVAKILSFSLWHPKIKMAFLESAEEADIESLYLDTADYYHCLWYRDYDYFGRNIESRWIELENMHGGNVPGAFVIPQHA